jgi:hypothetical protein
LFLFMHFPPPLYLPPFMSSYVFWFPFFVHSPFISCFLHLIFLPLFLITCLLIFVHSLISFCEFLFSCNAFTRTVQRSVSDSAIWTGRVQFYARSRSVQQMKLQIWTLCRDISRSTV